MRLTESDAGFLYGETASGALQTAGITVVAGEVPFEQIYEHMAARIHLVPRFRQRIAWVPMNLAHPKWVDDPDFQLENHVVHHALPEGTDMLDAVDAATEINQGLMDRSRPLWKYVVITGVPDRTLILQQIHHAMIDGASAVHLSTVIFDFQPNAEPPPPPDAPWQPAPLPNSFELASEAMRENAQAYFQRPALDVSRSAEQQELMRRGTQTLSRFATRPAIMAPWNAGLLGPKRRMRWVTYDFADFRAIRQAFGGTVNDVVLTVVSEGAARYLSHHDEATANQHLRIMCPVNVRTEDEEGALGNRVSAMFPMLPAWPMDVVERHREVGAEVAHIKESREAQALTLMQANNVAAPPVSLAPLQLIGTPFDPTAWIAQNPVPITPRVGPRPPFYGINFVCTNVPGVQVPQYIAGHEVLEAVGIMMMSGTLGYAVSVGSYNQKMLLSFTCEPRLLPDMERMVEDTQSAFEDLLAAARAEEKKKAKPKRRTTRKKQETRNG